MFCGKIATSSTGCHLWLQLSDWFIEIEMELKYPIIGERA